MLALVPVKEELPSSTNAQPAAEHHPHVSPHRDADLDGWRTWSQLTAPRGSVKRPPVLQVAAGQLQGAHTAGGTGHSRPQTLPFPSPRTPPCGRACLLLPADLRFHFPALSGPRPLSVWVRCPQQGATTPLGTCSWPGLSPYWSLSTAWGAPPAPPSPGQAPCILPLLPSGPFPCWPRPSWLPLPQPQSGGVPWAQALQRAEHAPAAGPRAQRVQASPLP